MLDHSGRGSTQVKAGHLERAELAITVEIVHQRGWGRLRWILPKSEQQESDFGQAALPTPAPEPAVQVRPNTMQSVRTSPHGLRRQWRRRCARQWPLPVEPLSR